VNYSLADTLWMLFGIATIFLMQAGFAMLETGFNRAKNAVNIIMINITGFAVSALCFWTFGYGILFGADLWGVIGTPDFFAVRIGQLNRAVPPDAFLLFEMLFCATSATIVSGAVAERIKLSGFLVYCVLLSVFIYPVSGHWIWGGGFLQQLGFHDLSGSAAIHLTGGMAALACAKAIGPRLGKYESDGSPLAIPGHNLPMSGLGVFLLWIGWFGFNTVSVAASSGGDAPALIARTALTTCLAASSSTITAFFVTRRRYRKADASMIMNAALGGLVGITAGADIVSRSGAVAVGVICGFLVVFGVEFVEKKLKVDDPVGAISVHGICGAAGAICVGLLAEKGGLLYDGGFRFFGVQLLGVLCTAAWSLLACGAVSFCLNKILGLRVSHNDEVAGLDSSEHGCADAYADFMRSTVLIVSDNVSPIYPRREIPINKEMAAVATGAIGERIGGVKMTKIDIITQEARFEKLKDAMNAIGVTGMTVSHVLGHGIQRGNTSLYRGVEMNVRILPKIRIEIIVSTIPVEKVIETAKEVLYTGHIGDGKIFVSDIENVVKIRTGEEGYFALQDIE
jgi:Amt family ammonium transporter